jgi:hypothetical protein
LLKGIPAKTFIVFTVLYLESFLRFVNMNMLFYVPLGAGISLNLKDMLILSCLFYFTLSARKDRVSFQLKLLLAYLGFCLVAVVVISILAYGASPSVIGDRLRYYFNYSLILGLVMLVDGDKNFRFLLAVIFGIGLFSCCIHFAEYIRGNPFYISGGGVTSKYFAEGGGAGSFMGMTRLWNRAPSINVLMFVLSAAFLASSTRKKLLFVLPFVFSLASIALSLTRTMYVFVALTIVAVFLMSILRKDGKTVFIGVLIAVIGMAGALHTMKNNPDMFMAMTGRFQTIVNIYTKGEKVETMSARQQQFEFLKRQMAEADIPPVFGLGINNETAHYMTSDLGFMNIIVNMGLAGILFIIFVFVYLFSRSRFLMNKGRDDLHKSVGMAIFCMLPGLLVIGYNFDYLTGTHFLLLALPVLLLEAAGYEVRRQSESLEAGYNAV